MRARLLAIAVSATAWLAACETPVPLYDGAPRPASQAAIVAAPGHAPFRHDPETAVLAGLRDETTDPLVPDVRCNHAPDITRSR